MNAVAWYLDNSAGGTKAVGTKAANELGIHDMTGNVEEWCGDVVSSSYRNSRGGSFYAGAIFCTLANPSIGLLNPGSIYQARGFRLARSLGN